MAIKITFASLAVLFFITTFSIFTSEATISPSPDLSSTTSLSPSSSPETSLETGFSTDYASERMISIGEEIKDFIRKYIKTRLEDSDKLYENTKKCLFKSFNSYEAALGIIEHAISDLTLKRYSNVIMALKGFETTIASTLDCPESVDLTTVNPEFKEMKEWTYFSIEDIVNGIKPCGSYLSDL